MRATLRSQDLIARWGGEEFTIALPSCAHADATTLLTHLAAVVPQHQTFSAGHTTLRPGETLEDCWDRADTHLYHAKHAGKNRIHTDPD